MAHISAFEADERPGPNEWKLWIPGRKIEKWNIMAPHTIGGDIGRITVIVTSRLPDRPNWPPTWQVEEFTGRLRDLLDDWRGLCRMFKATILESTDLDDAIQVHAFRVHELVRNRFYDIRDRPLFGEELRYQTGDDGDDILPAIKLPRAVKPPEVHEPEVHEPEETREPDAWDLLEI